MNNIDKQWYKKIWSLDIEDMSWVESTASEVDFLIEALELHGGERILDLACGFGRHALELARRGYSVLGVDITSDYITHARQLAEQDSLEKAEFVCADLRDVSYSKEFDVVLNMADGAIGYLETDEENLKIFNLVASALKPGGKHLMAVCSGDHARVHFPCRSWDIGSKMLSLADFSWEPETSRMIYKGYAFPYGDVMQKPLPPQELEPHGYTRLYTIKELDNIFSQRQMKIWKTFGNYDTGIPASDRQLMLIVCSQKQ